MPLPAKQLVINDTLVNYYHHTGEADKPVLVFLHGWRSEGAVWQGVIERLGGNYTVYALDLPGFGATPSPQKNFRLEDYADIIDDFIKKNKLDNVVIVGHSFGGRIAIKLAVTHPGYLKKIILVDSAGIRHASVSRNLKIAAAKIFKPIFSLPFLKSARQKIYKILGSEDYLATPKLRQTFINIINEDLTPLLQKITAPALLVWGGEDRDTPLEYGRIMEQLLPNSKLVVLENAGHFSFLDEPAAFTEALKNFL